MIASGGRMEEKRISAWTDEYRDVVEFFWWEPQMMGRSINNYRKFSSADDMWNSLSKKEVPFNHILNIFFALFPLDKLGIGLSPVARTLSSTELREQYTLQKGVTQPDIFITDQGENVGIELKTATISSRSQIEKYRNFSESISPKKPFRMVMLTPYLPGAVFKDGEPREVCPISYVSFSEFYRRLCSMKTHNSIEEKLIHGIVLYMDENLSNYM